MEVFIYVKKLLFVRTIINTKDDFVYKKPLRARTHQLDSNMEMRIANRFDSPIFCHVEGSINFWYVRRDCKNAIWHKSTVQTLNVCTSRPDICRTTWLYNHPWIACQNKASASITNIACESKIRSAVTGHPGIHAQETGWQLGVRSCFNNNSMPMRPRHLVQESNVVTVYTKSAWRELVWENAWRVEDRDWRYRCKLL